MKKNSLLLVVLFMFLFIPKVYASDFIVDVDQKTTVPEGYIGIYTKEDLRETKIKSNGKYILMNDIEFTEDDYKEGGSFYNNGKFFKPLFNSSTNSFSGIFDGNGHVIKNLKIYSNDKYIGLFGHVKNGTVKNLGFVDSNIVMANASNYSEQMLYLGGIVGKSTFGTISNCYNKGLVKGEKNNTNHNLYIGGLVGENSGSITNSYNESHVVSDNKMNVETGGIVGWSSGSIQNCYNIGLIESNGNTGGIVGQSNSLVSNCYNTGTIYGGSSAGGITGWDFGGTINNCYNTGKIKRYNGASVFGNKYFGGIVGQHDDTLEALSNCYNIGLVDVAIDNEVYIGGITGYAYNNQIQNCYSINGSNYNTNIGTYLEYNEMKNYENYIGFDFEDTWQSGHEGYTFPTLKNLRNVSLMIPDNPVLISKSETTVTLELKLNYEYSINNGETWQDSNIFTGLSPATQYIFYQRIRSTDEYSASNISEPLVVSTNKLQASVPADPELLSFGDRKVILKESAGYEYSIDNGETWQDSNIFTGLNSATQYTFYQRIKETDITYASEISNYVTVTTPYFIIYNVENRDVAYDGTTFGLFLDVVTEGVTIKYADEFGEYTLDTMPKYMDVGIYEIKYKMVKEGYATVTGSNILNIYNGTINFASSNNYKSYDGMSHGINLNVFTPDVTIKYADEEGNYTLSEMPKYSEPGTYRIKFELSKENYETIYGVSVVHISIGQIDFSVDAINYNYTGEKYGLVLNVYTDGVTVKYADEYGNYVLDKSPEYSEIGKYIIKYELTKENYNTVSGTAELTINTGQINYIESDFYTNYTGEKYGIHLEPLTEGVTIKYADEEGNYVLDEMPKYSEPGTYTISYQLTKDNYETIISSKTLVIYPCQINYEANDAIFNYDGKYYSIDLKVLTEGVTIKFADKDGNYTLKEMPKFKEAGIYTISFELSKNGYTTITSSKELTIYRGILNFNSSNKSIIYDGKNHGIDLTVSTPDVTIKYADEEGNYILNEMPKYSRPGMYKIKFQLFNESCYPADGEGTLTIFGISSISETLEIASNILKIKDYNFDINSLFNKINIFADSYSIKHYDKNKNEVTGSLRTSDYIKIFINEQETYEYKLSILGDVNGDGKISALDYVKIKNHIMKTNIIEEEVYKTAADVNDDKKISALDYVRIKNYIMNGGN